MAIPSVWPQRNCLIQGRVNNGQARYKRSEYYYIVYGCNDFGPSNTGNAGRMKKLLTILLLALFLGACGGEATVARPFEAEPTAIPTITPSVITTPTLDPSEYEDPNGRSVWNFVVLGSDFRADDPQRQYEHTDAFILVNVREEEDHMLVTLMPIARELWMDDWGIIHSVYQRFDYQGVRQMVGQEFGIFIDAIFYTDLDNFTAFIDDIGGLQITPSMNVYDECGGIDWELNEGETYDLDGLGVLCYARMRKGTENGYFDRQFRHAEILSALWTQMRSQIMGDSLGLINAVFANPFVTVWPNEEWLNLANLTIRASLWRENVIIRIASLDHRYMTTGTQIGPLADGTVGPYYVQYPSVDLHEWFTCASQANLITPVNLCLLP